MCWVSGDPSLCSGICNFVIPFVLVVGVGRMSYGRCVELPYGESPQLEILRGASSRACSIQLLASSRDSEGWNEPENLHIQLVPRWCGCGGGGHLSGTEPLPPLNKEGIPVGTVMGRWIGR